MRIKGLLKDRQPLIKQLSQETGIMAEYEGAPSFKYRIGPYTVLRDGSINVDDDLADRGLLQRLADLKLISLEHSGNRQVAFATEGFTGRTMVNLVNTLAARGEMINKALGVPDAVRMDMELVQYLKDTRSNSMQEFVEVLYRCGGEKAIQGLQLTPGQLTFTNFPYTEASYTLAKHVVNAAVTKQWKKASAPADSNEKYSFRVWLNSIGMIGPEFSKVRAELLKNLTGDAAHRTQEQQQAFYKKLRKKRSKPEPDFILL